MMASLIASRTLSTITGSSLAMASSVSYSNSATELLRHWQTKACGLGVETGDRLRPQVLDRAVVGVGIQTQVWTQRARDGVAHRLDVAGPLAQVAQLSLAGGQLLAVVGGRYSAVWMDPRGSLAPRYHP